MPSPECRYSRIAVPLYTRAEFRAVCIQLLKLELGARAATSSKLQAVKPLSDTFGPASFKTSIKRRSLAALGRSSACLLRGRSSAGMLVACSDARPLINYTAI